MTRVPGERDARLIDVAGLVLSATVSLAGVTVAIHLAHVGFAATAGDRRRTEDRLRPNVMQRVSPCPTA